MSPAINYVLVFCSQCSAVRKIAPERAYEPGSFEFPLPRPIECPLCHARMRLVAEYGSPSWPSRGSFPLTADAAEWMT